MLTLALDIDQGQEDSLSVKSAPSSRWMYRKLDMNTQSRVDEAVNQGGSSNSDSEKDIEKDYNTFEQEKHRNELMSDD